MRRLAVVTDDPFLETEYVGDEIALTQDQRSGRCYELAAYALLFGSAPEGSTLVHGTIQGPQAGHLRIGHAWLSLPDGTVWEPLLHEIHHTWDDYADTIVERTYTKEEAARMVVLEGHWGPWHQTAGVTRAADGSLLNHPTPEG